MIINPEQICIVRVYIKKIDFWYTYKEKTKAYWFKKSKPEGFYCHNVLEGEILHPKEFIEYGGKLYCEGKTVYHKPFVNIEMSNGEEVTKYFSSEKDLNSFMESENMKKVRWVKL